MSSENSRHWVMPRRLFRPDFIENRFVGPNVLSEDLPVFVFIVVRSLSDLMTFLNYLFVTMRICLSLSLSDSMIFLSCSCLLHASPWQWAPASGSRSPPRSSSAPPSTPPSGAPAPLRSNPRGWPKCLRALGLKWKLPGSLPRSHYLLVRWCHRGSPEIKRNMSKEKGAIKAGYCVFWLQELNLYQTQKNFYSFKITKMRCQHNAKSPYCVWKQTIL